MASWRVLANFGGEVLGRLKPIAGCETLDMRPGREPTVAAHPGDPTGLLRGNWLGFFRKYPGI